MTYKLPPSELRWLYSVLHHMTPAQKRALTALRWNEDRPPHINTLRKLELQGFVRVTEGRLYHLTPLGQYAARLLRASAEAE